MIWLSNDHGFKHMAASGALGFDGRGWPWEQPLRWLGLLDPNLMTVVLKTLTYEPRRGNLRMYNPLGCIRPLVGGAVNAVGLTNGGYKWWCEEVGPHLNFMETPLIASILGEPNELVEMARSLDKFGFVGLEINASCPNTKGDILKNTAKVIEGCERVYDATKLPLILKVSVAHSIEEIIEGTKGIVEAYAINSVPWKLAFPDRKSPLAHLGGGGVSGKMAQRFTWPLVERIHGLTQTPVIGPSVWEYKDIKRLREDLGASAVSYGAIFLARPWAPTMYIKRDRLESAG